MAKTQWHPAFCAAMRLELKDNPTLQFTNEFNLTEKPLEVDMLIIKKPPGSRIDNKIGEFFREHNLLEYKSPTDHAFNEFAISQALSYAYYYCNKYRTWDVTLSLVVSKEHFDLLKWLKAQGTQLTRRHDGIYTLEGISFLKVQIIVTEELDGRDFQWLAPLTDRLTEAQARNFVTSAYELAGKEERRLAEAIAEVLTSANVELFEKMKEDDRMGSALFELMRPEVEKYAEEYAGKYAKKYAENQVRENDIKHARAMIRQGVDNDFIKLVVDMPDSEIDKLRKSMQ